MIRKPIFFAVAVLFCVTVNAQNVMEFQNTAALPDSLTGASVRVYVDNSALGAIEKYVAQTPPQQNIEGYRIRIFSGNGQSARSEAEAVQARFCETYNVPIYFTYKNPYFLVSCGNCVTQEEAIMLLAKIKVNFPKAFIVSSSIPVESIEQ